jgi:hypothetical protein
MSERDQIRSLKPAGLAPKAPAGFVIGDQKDRAPRDPFPSEQLKALPHHLSTDAFPLIRRCHGQVIQISPPAVLATKDGARKLAVHAGCQAKARIAAENPLELLPRLARPYAWSRIPQRHCRVVIARFQLPKLKIMASIHLNPTCKEAMHNGLILLPALKSSRLGD